MKLGIFLASVATKFGIDTTSPEFAEVLASGTEIPDNIANLYVNNNGLMTLEAAKNNPLLKNHFTATVLNPIDSNLDALMTEFELPDEIKAELKGNPNTYQRVPAVVRKIQELIIQRAGASGKAKDDLTNQINALQQKLATSETAMQTTLAQKEEAHMNEMKDLLLDAIISGKKLNTSAFPAETIKMIARKFVDDALVNKGVKIKNVNRTLQLKQAAEEALDYYENNAPVSVDSFVEQVLANNKLLAVTDQSTATGTMGFPPQLPNTRTSPSVPLAGMSTKLDRAMADYNSQGARVV